MRLTALIPLAIVVTSSASATTFSNTALDNIALASRAAISGDVRAKKTLLDAAGVPWTIYTLAVDGVLAGEFSDSEFSFRVIGGDNPDGSTLVLVGAPQFTIGDAIVIFYDPEGACQVSGLQFGAFWRRSNEAGESRLVNYRGEVIASFSEHGPVFSDQIIPIAGSFEPQIQANVIATGATEAAAKGIRPPPAQADVALDELQAFSARYVVRATRVSSTTDLSHLPDLSPAAAPVDSAEGLANTGKGASVK